MSMQRVRAFRRKPPQPRAENLASRPLEKIRVRDLHQVRRPPRKVLRLDQEVAVDGFHIRISILNQVERALRAR